MDLKFSSWLQEHTTEIEAQWLNVVEGLPTYSSLSPDERLSCWRPLLEALTAKQDEGSPQALLELAQQWLQRETDKRGAAPSELLSLASGLSQVIDNLLLPGMDRSEVDRRLSNLAFALGQSFADQAERLAAEKLQLETLHEIIQDLTSSLDLPRVLQKALDGLMTATDAEMGAILLTDDEMERVVPETRINWSGGEVDRRALPSLWQMGRPEPLLVVEDIRTKEIELWLNKLVDPDVRSLIVGPMIANGQFRGLLALASRRRAIFGSDHVRLFRNVLNEISTAVGNAEINHLISQQARELGQMFRHQQEQATERQAILTSIADGVVVNDTEGKVILINPAGKRILGISGEELIGQDFHELFSVFDTQGEEEAIAAMETLLSTPVPEITKTFRMNLQTEKRVIHALLSPVLTEREDFLGVVTIFRDITKEVEADRAKSEFVSTVSHELRTPMTAIKGYTDLLHAGAAGPISTEQQRFLSTIKTNTDRLTALINDLLDISRMETGRVRFQLEPVRVSSVIADVVNALAGQAEAKHQSLTYEVVGGLPNVMGDRDRLNQVLTNLVGNAIRYTPEEGDIEVHAYPVERAIRVDVRDTGIGIAPEDVAHIFDRFYRADHPLVQETRGTGLGLSIVKMFVEMHGGRVWVESEQGQGSTFTFILPAPDQGEEQPEPRILPGLSAQIRTVLVVDDDQSATDIIKRQLEMSGYRVFVLGRGRPTEEWVQENQPDLILLDMVLPDIGGLEILRALKENPATTDIPVIVISIVPDDGSAQQLGVVDYLIKPLDRERLLQSVEQALTWQGRVLIVEDDPDTINLLVATVRQVGFTSLVAPGGYEALAMARRHRPDLILLDLRLPGMDGYEVLTHLKRDAVTQTIPIVAISAHVADTDQERKRLIALGATSFLAKPFSIGDLLSEIEEALKPISGPTPL